MEQIQSEFKGVSVEGGSGRLKGISWIGGVN